MLVARLDRIRETAAVLDIVNADYTDLENRDDLIENRMWCIDQINTLENAIITRERVNNDTSRFAKPGSHKSIPKYTEDEMYEQQLIQIKEEYLKDLNDGMLPRQAEPIDGKAYEKELIKTIIPHFKLVDKIVKRKTENGKKKVLVSFVGHNAKFNEWMTEEEYKRRKKEE